MKRYGLILALSTLLVLVSAGASLAVFPEPDGSVVLPLHQGWFNGDQAWFIGTDTTDPTIAASQRLTMFQAIPTTAAPVYIVTNPLEAQGPVFSAAPDPVQRPYPPPPYYSGLWRVVYVDWHSNGSRVPLVSDQQILDLQSQGELSLFPTRVAVDYSIMAIGPLGEPDYLIPQAQDVNLAMREIQLPTWDTYVQDYATNRTFIKHVIIPDALSLQGWVPGNIDLAHLIGANPAYGLSSIGPVDTNDTIAAIDWTQFLPNGGVLPVPGDQALVSRDAPTVCGSMNIDGGYSPFATVVVMARFPSVPPWAVFSNWGQVANSPGLVGVLGDTVNAPVLCE